jgi:hypothetical protein
MLATTLPITGKSELGSIPMPTPYPIHPLPMLLMVKYSSATLIQNTSIVTGTEAQQLPHQPLKHWNNATPTTTTNFKENTCMLIQVQGQADLLSDSQHRMRSNPENNLP